MVNARPIRSRPLTQHWSRPSFLAFLVVGLLLLLPSASAAQTPDTTLRIVEVAHQPGGPMSITFEAPSADLSTLELLLDGAPAAFDVVSSEQPSPNLVLAIENSASMTGSQLAELNTVAASLIDSLGAGTQVAIVTYGGGAETVLSFTSDHVAVSAAIAGLTLGGGAALYSGVESAAELAKTAEGEAVIVLVTYGWDWGSVSTTSRDASIEAIAGSVTPVYVQSMVFYGEDAAYLSALATDGTVHTLSELPVLASAADLLTGSAVSQHTIEIDQSLLTGGHHEISLALEGASDTVVIEDEGLLSVTPVDMPVDGSSLTFTVTASSELAGADILATINGKPIDVSPAGTIEVDPWQFAPGGASIEVRAVVGEAQLSSASATASIPRLEPIIETSTAADGSTLTATLRAQPGTVSELVASVDGEAIGNSSTGVLEVALPDGGTVIIEARSAEGVLLLAASVSVEPVATLPATDAGSGSPSYLLIIGGLLIVLTLGAAVVARRRRARLKFAPPAPAATATATATAEVAQRTPVTQIPHTPVELHPVGNWDLVIQRQGHDEQRLPLGPGAISIGASPLCDVTLDGRDIRFVHAVIGPDGPQLRIHRFGPVTIDGLPLKAESANLTLQTELVVADAAISLVAHGSHRSQRAGGSAAA